MQATVEGLGGVDILVANAGALRCAALRPAGSTSAPADSSAHTLRTPALCTCAQASWASCSTRTVCRARRAALSEPLAASAAGLPCSRTPSLSLPCTTLHRSALLLPSPGLARRDGDECGGRVSAPPPPTAVSFLARLLRGQGRLLRLPLHPPPLPPPPDLPCSYHCCRAVHPHMQARGGGKIVVMSSIAGIRGEMRGWPRLWMCMPCCAAHALLPGLRRQAGQPSIRPCRRLSRRRL